MLVAADSFLPPPADFRHCCRLCRHITIYLPPHLRWRYAARVRTRAARDARARWRAQKICAIMMRNIMMMRRSYAAQRCVYIFVCLLHEIRRHFDDVIFSATLIIVSRLPPPFFIVTLHAPAYHYRLLIVAAARRCRHYTRQRFYATRTLLARRQRAASSDVCAPVRLPYLIHMSANISR